MFIVVCGDKCVGDADPGVRGGAARAGARGCAGDVHRVASRAPIRGRLANVSALIVAVVTRRTLIAQFEHLLQTCIGVSPRLNLQPLL